MPRRSLTMACLWVAFASISGRGDGGAGPVAADVVIVGGTLIDGTGEPGKRGDVAIKGDRIVAVGAFAIDPKARVINARGWVVAPGFIDLHSHSDGSILNEPTRDNRNFQAQGVTTIVTGNCGGGPIDVAKYFASIEARGVGSNVIHLIPHGDVRQAVLGGGEIKAGPDAMQAMAAIVEKGMLDGAWGLSSGLIYVPSRYADAAELTALSRVVARHGGLYASHIRNEGEHLLEAVNEAIAIGRDAGAPVHISHLKANGKPNWGQTKQACAAIEAARAVGGKVTADQYPYVASSTSLAAMVVPHWAAQGDAANFTRIAADPVAGPRLRQAILDELAKVDGGASIRIARFNPDPSIVGLDLVAIAQRGKTNPLEVVLDIQRRGGAQAISFGMSEADVRDVMTHPYVATASDGSAHRPGGGDKPHPRAYGTFPRKIRYALDDRVMTLEQAIRSCTGLPAAILGLPDRGTIRRGAYADLVVFDPRTFRDAATWDDPTRYAAGLQYLFVNGKAAVAAGKFVDRVHPGRVLRLTRDGPADVVLKLGRIWTGDPDHAWADSVAIRDGRIAAIGTSSDVEPFIGARTQTIAIPAGFATPGLVDAHAHLRSLGASLEEVDLRGVASLDELARRVKARVDSTPGDGWIVGRGFDQSLWPGGEFADASVLDKVAPRRPVWLRRVDGHAGWANSEAMRRAGLSKDSKAPSDGRIVRDKDNAPTGVLIDGAMNLITKAIPPATAGELARQILAGQAEALKQGLTGIHDAGISHLEIEAYTKLDREGKLKLRVYGMASPPAGGEAAFVSRAIPRAWRGRRFEIRGIKLYIDGALGSRGGLLFAPYSDEPQTSGLMLIDPKTLEAVTLAALKHGWQVSTHAIGDKANALVLDAYAAAIKASPHLVPPPRLRIEHAQVVRKEDVARFKELGVIASMQPSHAIDDMRWADARLGKSPGRVDGAYAWRWFLDAGVPLAFGSDFPVEVVNPFYGLYAAITRQDDHASPAGGWHPDQVLTLDEALRAFTSGAAFAAFDESAGGVLKPGARADLTVVDRDLFRVKPLDLLKSRVLATIVGGEVVYRAK